MEATPGIDYQAVLADLKKKRDDLNAAISGRRSTQTAGISKRRPFS